jgi:uncharacterized membrane protein YdjX (TVP38/TMEM64 family)
MQSRVRTIIAIVILLGAVAALLTLPVHELMMAFISWVRGHGIYGALLFGIVYAAATVAFIPGSLLTLGAGFVYGPLWGLALVSPASVLGATAAFFLARGRLRPWVRAKVEGNERFAAIDRAVGREGFKIVMLLRLSPMFPYTLLNYALGLTEVRPRSYVLASFIGMLPGTFLYVYLGSLVPNLAELASGPPPEGADMMRQVFFWGGLVATAATAVFVGRTARRALAKSLPSTEGTADEPPTPEDAT